MDDERWTMDDERWTMGSGRWTKDDGRWTDGHPGNAKKGLNSLGRIIWTDGLSDDGHPCRWTDGRMDIPEDQKGSEFVGSHNLDGWTDGRMDGRMRGWRMDGWTDGRMDGWTDGWTDVQRPGSKGVEFAEPHEHQTSRFRVL
jgi:hypothetical protein